MSNISDKAFVSPKARIGNNCKIYPFVYIEDDVVIGDNCVLYPFVSVLNGTRMGNDNTVYQGAVLAALPPDFNFRGEESCLVIGNHNVLRENVVINRATHSDGKTVIGDRNFLMEGSHISHDTKVGNDCVFGYGTKIAGDCELLDSVIFSSGVIENPGTRVGQCAMIQAGTSFSKDVPPYIIAGGAKVSYGGVNTTVCRFRGIDEKVIKHIANAYRLVFHGQTSLFDACNQIDAQVPDGPEIRSIVEFLRSTKQGVITKR